MPTECNPTLFEFAPVDGRRVVAAFDGGAITSDAGALLLGETDRAIRLTERLAACIIDARVPELVEHEISTMVLQRVVGIALGYEDLNDHDELRHDPVLAVQRWVSADSCRIWLRDQAAFFRSALSSFLVFLMMPSRNALAGVLPFIPRPWCGLLVL